MDTCSIERVAGAYEILEPLGMILLLAVVDYGDNSGIA